MNANYEGASFVISRLPISSNQNRIHSIFMKRIISYSLLLLLISGLGVSVSAQSGAVYNHLVSTLRKTQEQYPQEKVYLHFDKPYYVAGETIWFKAYLFDASYHTLDSASRVLYVDLIHSATGKVVLQKKLKSSGVASGDFQLPDTLSADTYHVRAYTQYMRNFSENLFFEKSIKIFQDSPSTGNPEFTSEMPSSVATISFFPEGGNLVENIESRVAFKARNKKGQGFDVEGFVLDNLKDTVASFHSVHLGMGVFNIKPVAGKSYTAFIKKGDGSYFSQMLPKAQGAGYTITVDNVTFKDKIRLFVQNSSPTTTLQELPIIIQQRGKVCMVLKGSSSEKSFTVNIPRTQIPDDGITQITLFSSEGKPLAERLIFVEQNKQLHVKVKSKNSQYNTRGKTELELEVTDAEGKPVKGSFSMAVTDVAQVQHEPFAEDIQTYLLLNSDVREEVSGKNYTQLTGNIEQPRYYFESSNANRLWYLDLLMMTQGWRRFNWNQMLGNTMPELKYDIEDGLTIKGKALRPNGKVSENINLSLMMVKPNTDPVFKTVLVDASGNFKYSSLNFTDSTEAYLQVLKGSGTRNISINLDEGLDLYWSTPLQIPKDIRYPDEKGFEFFLRKTREALTIEKNDILNKTQELKEVTVSAKREVIDNRNLYIRASNTLKINESICVGAFNVLQMISGRIPGVQVYSNGERTYTVYIFGQGSVALKATPLFLLDGLQVSLEVINNLTPCEIEKVDVLKGVDAGIYGVLGGNGVLSFLSRTSNVNNVNRIKFAPAGVKVVKLLGYAMEREFESPQYIEAKPQHVNPDYRSTIFWKSNIVTNHEGKASITYFNSDNRGKMRVQVEGVSHSGRIGVANFQYEVK